MRELIRKPLGDLKREIYYALDRKNNELCRELFLKNKLPKPYKRIYHYHVRKTGGTSLNSSFLSLGGFSPQNEYMRLNKHFHQRIINHNKVFVGWNPKLITEGNYFYAFSHLPSHKMNLPKDTFTITCLRDPIERLMSLYKMLRKQEMEGGQHPGFRSQKQYIKKTFEEFIDVLPRSELENQIYMFSSTFQVEEALDKIRNCDCYFFTKKFNTGLNKINSQLNLSLMPLHVRASKSEILLSDDVKNKVREKLKNEYTLLEKLTVTN